jgi:uncharacterized membrane protein YeaQ/YmgE (transglycosylase-associated protein family)
MLGAIAFGIVIGWVTHRTLRRQETTQLGDIAAVVGAVGGAAVMRIYPSGSDLFAWYAAGLALGFFGYLVVALIFAPQGRRRETVGLWLGSTTGPPPAPRP